MPLVEIIKGKKTWPKPRRGFDFVQQIRKTPIVVNDSRGFYTSAALPRTRWKGLTMMLLEGQHRARSRWRAQAGMRSAPLAVRTSVRCRCRHTSSRPGRLRREGRTLPEHPGSKVIEEECQELNRRQESRQGFYSIHLHPVRRRGRPTAPSQQNSCGPN